jgi:hypothetical protein
MDAKYHWMPLATIIAALCTAASATSLAQSASHARMSVHLGRPEAQTNRRVVRSVSSPEQTLASINDARQQSTAYVNGLAGALQSERRDDGWAKQTESALRGSFAVEESLPHDALSSVECRSTKCNLEVNLGAASSPAALVEQQAAITHWISVSQPCAFTMTDPTAQTIRIFLNCKR